MTKKMMNVAVVAVLAAAVLAPVTTYAAPRDTQLTTIESRTGMNLFDMVARFFGFKSVTESRKATPTHTAPATGMSGQPGQATPGVSTEGAIWGGNGRCYYIGC